VKSPAPPTKLFGRRMPLNFTALVCPVGMKLPEKRPDAGVIFTWSCWHPAGRDGDFVRAVERDGLLQPGRRTDVAVGKLESKLRSGEHCGLRAGAA